MGPGPGGDGGDRNRGPPKNGPEAVLDTWGQINMSSCHARYCAEEDDLAFAERKKTV